MIYTRNQINEIINTNDRAVERAMVRLFALQNSDEQRHGTTNEQNGRGFSSSSARAGTRFARWILGMDDKNVIRYAPKSLSHPKAGVVFRNYCHLQTSNQSLFNNMCSNKSCTTYNKNTVF